MSYADDALHYDPFAADAAADARGAFIRRTYIHLFGAILAFIGLEAVFLGIEPLKITLINVIGGNFWIAAIAFFAVSWVANWWAHSGVSPALQYLGLAAYVVAEALIFVPLLFFAHSFNETIIPTAGFLTLLIFGGLTVTVMVSGADFSFLRGFLVVASLLAVGAIVGSFIFGYGLGIWFSAAMIGIASGFILYDTSNVLHHYRTDQYVAASLALFASVATLLWYVIRLLMSLGDD
ncbi:MAG: Bax inhibitor-1 family protein [Planctomycetaceae bacterium]